MGDDPIRGIHKILEAQSSRSQPRPLQLPSLLPPIGFRAHTSQPFPAEGQETTPRLNISAPLNQLDVRRRFSLISRASSNRSPSPREDKDFASTLMTKEISTVPFKIAQLPATLPAIPGLSIAVDNLSSHRLRSIHEACRLYDSEYRGYLSQPSVLKCIGEIVPSAHAPDSPWRELLEELAPHGEFIDYNEMLKLIGRHQSGGNVLIDPIPTIPEVLGTNAAGTLMDELPSRPTTSQASRERGRVEVMLDIETVLIRNPELDIESLKMVTHQKVMEQSELITLLELYGLLEHFKPFLHRLLDCFLTFDNKFHYTAFIGCLQTSRIRKQNEDIVRNTLRWQNSLPPLDRDSSTTRKKI